MARSTSPVDSGRPRRANAWRRKGSPAIGGRSSTRVDTGALSASRERHPWRPGTLRKFRAPKLCAALRDHRQRHAARLAATGVAVAEVPLDPALVPDADRVGRPLGEDRTDALAALAADELGVLLLEAPARAEERALDLRAGHPEALPEFVVGEALELAHDQDLVVGLAEAAKRALQVVERLLVLDGRLRRRHGQHAAGLDERLHVVVADLGAAARAGAQMVDRAVAG